MDAANVGNAFFAFKVVSYHTLGETLTLKLPKHETSLAVHLYVNSAQNTFHRRRADFSPLCRLFASVSTRIMDFAVGKMEA